MKTVPGTNIEFDESESVFEKFSPFINATDGLSLGQICSITGLEPFVVQNWVKRGYVAHPVNKKYGRRHLARILLISCLRDALQLERIGAILAYVNGDTDDESDDIITEDRLFDAFCLSLKLYAEDPQYGKGPQEFIDVTLHRLGYTDPDALAKLNAALTVMVYGYVSGTYKRLSEDAYTSLAGA